MRDKYCIVKTSVAPLYSKPNFKSELISQSLIWEKLYIIKKNKNWYKVKQWDNYVSWIHSSYISNNNINIDYKKDYGWFFLNKTIIKKELLLSFGSLMPFKKINDNGDFYMLLPDLSKVHINKKYLISVKHLLNSDDLINFALTLKGIPYLWGGKSSFGYDCSGFIQSLIRLKGINFPRDCSDQTKSKLIESKSIEGIKKCDLIYFKENSIFTHVGLFINSVEFIHCSGEVKINSINKNNKFYCSNLSELEFSIYRFKK
ncbi:MAG: hypothetical protein CMG50_04240 [Candidatus Marinimicrobia bacterium]|nr:hypothetical protein [Candidatus Neomarinimicrobiota bacterium]